MKKLLVLSDSPTVNTGFACVVRNLLRHWKGEFERQIDVWGINYNGWPHLFDYRIFPAGRDWTRPENLANFLNLILAGDYSHLFILQDTFLLSKNEFPKYLRDVCTKMGTKIITYFPVDAPLEQEWMEIVHVSDQAVTYTEYGRRQAGYVTQKPVTVIPHGVESDQYYPLNDTDESGTRGRLGLREIIFREWCGPDRKNTNDTRETIVLVNVNRNERRKGLIHSLQVLKYLKQKWASHQWKLYLHALAENPMEQIDLHAVAGQLGLKAFEDYLFPDPNKFERGVGAFSEADMNRIYNAGDVCITTSMGEGWGLSVTEALAAGCPVVAPNHTSMPEIWERVGTTTGKMHIALRDDLPIVNAADNSRVRYPVDVESMVGQIFGTVCAREHEKREGLSDELKQWWSWERIAGEFLKLFRG